MQTDDLMNLKLEPFRSDRCNLSYILTLPEQVNICMMNLLILYYSKLLPAQEISAFKMAEANPLWDCRFLSQINRPGPQKQMGDFFNTVISTLPEWSSFHHVSIDLSSVERMTNREWEDLKMLDQMSKIHLITKQCKDCFSDQEYALFQKVPKPVLDSLDFSHQRKAVYFYSNRLLKYIKFADCNPDIIRNQFSKEHKKILKALTVLKHPLTDESIRITFSVNENFMLGFYMGLSYNRHISICDYNWNFFIAMYVLERLLDLADSLFYF